TAGAAICGTAHDTFPHLPNGTDNKKSGQRCGGGSPALRSSAYECRLAETHRARRLRLLGSPPDLVHSGPVVQGPHPYAEPRSKALSDLVAHSLAVSICYFIIFRPGFQPPPLFREKAWHKASLCTINFPGLRHFRGAFTPALARYVCACGAVRCKVLCSLVCSFCTF